MGLVARNSAIHCSTGLFEHTACLMVRGGAAYLRGETSPLLGTNSNGEKVDFSECLKVDIVQTRLNSSYNSWCSAKGDGDSLTYHQQDVARRFGL